MDLMRGNLWTEFARSLVRCVACRSVSAIHSFHMLLYYTPLVVLYYPQCNCTWTTSVYGLHCFITFSKHYLCYVTRTSLVTNGITHTVQVRNSEPGISPGGPSHCS